MLPEHLRGTLAYLKDQLGAILVGQSEQVSKHPKLRGARQVYEALKAQIEEGVYRPSARLPSTRALATELGASRTTITAAYEQLVAEGFIETRQGRQARVTPALRSSQFSRANSPKAPAPARLSAFGRRRSELDGPAVAAEPLQVDFRYGDIAASDFPHLAWRRPLTKALTRSGSRSLRYQDPAGSKELRAALQAYLWRARSHQLLRWADKAGAYVIEDDYDGEYRYDIRPIPPLQTVDEATSVIYLGPFSKTLSPLLRLGYLVVPTELVDAFRAAKQLTDRHSPSLEQAALAELIQSGTYERHIRKLRRKNAQRRAALLDALWDHFGDAVEVQGSEAGLHVVTWFNTFDVSHEDDIARQARQRGVGIYPISGLYGDGRGVAPKRRAGFIFGYAAHDEREIRHGVARLAHALRRG